MTTIRTDRCTASDVEHGHIDYYTSRCPTCHLIRGNAPSERDYLAEAHAILDGTSLLEPERAHLQALLEQTRRTP
jgi:hypothetical protein